MKLSARDRAKVSAALALIHDAGHNPDDVTRVAQTIIGMGTPSRLAYDRAFNKFVEQVPAFRGKLHRLGQLIEASDVRTVAAYNVALAQYNETGDAAALQPIIATVAQDMAQMARQTGDAGFTDFLEVPAPPPATPSPNDATPARPGWGPTGYNPKDAQTVAPVE